MIKIFKNRYGLVRSGWIIILCLILYYALLGVAQIFIIATMRKLLEITGNLDYSTGFSIPPVDTMNDVQFAIIPVSYTHLDVYKRQVREMVKSGRCPYCSGSRLTRENSLAARKPELLEQWDWEKNEDSPWELSCANNGFAYWICEKGHSWKAKICLLYTSRCV